MKYLNLYSPIQVLHIRHHGLSTEVFEPVFSCTGTPYIGTMVHLMKYLNLYSPIQVLHIRYHGASNEVFEPLFSNTGTPYTVPWCI